MAAEILTTVTGTPFPTYVRRQVLEPIGARRATFDHRAVAHDPDRAEGHSTGHPRLPVRIPMVAAGGLWASVEDACRYARFHLNRGKQLMEPALLEEQYDVPFAPSEQSLGYGLGISSRRRKGVLLRGHSGGGFGFLSDTYWAPEKGVGVAVVTNSDNHRLQGVLVFNILEDLIDTGGAPAIPRLPPRRPAVSAAEAALAAGEYVSRDDRVTIRIGDRGLVLEGAGGMHPLHPMGNHHFAVEDGTGEIYRVLAGEHEPAAYLQRQSEGFMRYRNQLPDVRSPKATRRFDVREFGKFRAVATLIVANDGSGQFNFADNPPVRVDQEQPRTVVHRTRRSAGLQEHASHLRQHTALRAT